MLPLGCLPLWGREGVTLTAAADNYRMTEKRGFQQSPEILKGGNPGVQCNLCDNGGQYRYGYGNEDIP